MSSDKVFRDPPDRWAPRTQREVSAEEKAETFRASVAYWCDVLADGKGIPTAYGAICVPVPKVKVRR